MRHRGENTRKQRISLNSRNPGTGRPDDIIDRTGTASCQRGGARVGLHMLPTPCHVADATLVGAALRTANALARQWALDLAWNLTDHADSSFMPITLQRLPHTHKLDLWGPPSHQYRYQQSSPPEVSTMRIFTSLAKRCGNPSTAPLVIELGANEGTFGSVASGMGCRVLSVEPQPACIRTLAFAAALAPPRRHVVCLVHGFVSDRPLSMKVKGASPFALAALTSSSLRVWFVRSSRQAPL